MFRPKEKTRSLNLEQKQTHSTGPDIDREKTGRDEHDTFTSGSQQSDTNWEITTGTWAQLNLLLHPWDELRVILTYSYYNN
jgi:hypothetical protein